MARYASSAAFYRRSKAVRHIAPVYLEAARRPEHSEFVDLLGKKKATAGKVGPRKYLGRHASRAQEEDGVRGERIRMSEADNGDGRSLGKYLRVRS
jgi:hypothetical protein